MSLLKDTRIGARLLAAFLSLTIILVATGWIGLRGVNTIHGDLVEIFGTRMPSLDLLLQVDRDLHQLLVAERSMIFADRRDKVFEELLKEYETNLKQAAERWTKYKALPLTDAEKALFPTYEANLDAWQKISRQIVEARKADTREGRALALDLSLTQARTSFETMREVINQLTEINNATAKEADASASDAYEQARTTVIAFTAAGLLIALLLAALITRSITRPLGRCVDFSKKITHGDLGANLEVEQKDESGILAAALRSMVGTLKTKIGEANDRQREAADEAEKARAATARAEEARAMAETAKRDGMLAAADRLQGVVEIVTSASEELSAQIEESSRGSEQQSTRIGETATAMEEMNATVLEVAKNASQAADTADRARHKADEGATVVDKVVLGIREVQHQAQEMKADMASLGEQAEGIGRIMNVITDIADQTNLLALNAAIEAARAGDAGRGFAVVADEVRKLAEKTMSATKEVGEAIRGIQQGTRKNVENVDRTTGTIEEATRLAGQSGEALKEILSLVETAADQVRSIATASEEQSSASEEISRSIEDISRIASDTADAMRQSAQAVSELAEQSQNLRSLIEEMQSS